MNCVITGIYNIYIYISIYIYTYLYTHIYKYLYIYSLDFLHCMKFTGMHEFMHYMIFIFFFSLIFFLLFSSSLLDWFLEEPCGLMFESCSCPKTAISQLVHLSIPGHQTALLCIILPPSVSVVLFSSFLPLQHKVNKLVSFRMHYLI